MLSPYEKERLILLSNVYVCVCLGGSVVGALACIHIVTSLMMMHVTLGLDRNVHKDANAHGNPFGLLSGE